MIELNLKIEEVSPGVVTVSVNRPPTVCTENEHKMFKMLQEKCPEIFTPEHESSGRCEAPGRN